MECVDAFAHFHGFYLENRFVPVEFSIVKVYDQRVELHCVDYFGVQFSAKDYRTNIYVAENIHGIPFPMKEKWEGAIPYDDLDKFMAELSSKFSGKLFSVKGSSQKKTFEEYFPTIKVIDAEPDLPTLLPPSSRFPHSKHMIDGRCSADIALTYAQYIKDNLTYWDV